MSALSKLDLYRGDSFLFYGSEPDQYHDVSARDGTAFFAMLTSTPDNQGRRQLCYPVSAMPLVLRELDRHTNTWISQAEFYTWTRRLVHFKQVGLCWVDIDSYKVPGLVNKTPDELLAVLLRTCENVGLPDPSIVVFSGRGLQVKWLLDGALPRAALPRWNLVQRELCHRLGAIGGDPKASDGSRVLRLVNTVNTASGEMVCVIYDPLHKYSFDKLADSVLPLSRAQIQELRHLRQVAAAGQQFKLYEGGQATAPKDRPRGHLSVVDSSKANLRPFVASQLAWDRLGDLDKLARLRQYTHGAPDGHRDTFVFLGAVLLAWSCVQVPKFTQEVAALADKYAPHWSKERVRQCVSGVVARMARFRAGERVEYDGKRFDPRYRFGNAKLQDWLEITSAEERELATIISKPEKARRHRETELKRSREAGAVPRATYEANAEQKRATGRLMRAQGGAWATIAAAVGYKNAETARIACR